MKKQIIAKLMVLCMMLSLLPASALAVDGGTAVMAPASNWTYDYYSDDYDTWAPSTTPTTPGEPETPAAPAVVVEEQVEATVTEEEGAVTAAATVEAKDMAAKVAKAVAAREEAGAEAAVVTLKLELALPEGTDAANVTAGSMELPAAELGSMAEANVALEVNLHVASVTIGIDVLAQLGAGGEKVNVSARISLFSRGQRAGGEVEGYEINLTKDGEDVGEIAGGLGTAVAAADATSGTVAVVVNADGTEKIQKMAVVKDGSMKVTLPGSGMFYLEDNAKSFSDASGWAEGYIDFVSSRDLFNGVAGGVFAPESNMNRAMMVTVLHRLADLPEGGNTSFADVPADVWFTEAVAWAASAGIAEGTGTGFDPFKDMTRAELATFLYRFADKVVGADVSAKGDLSTFDDVDDLGAAWVAEAMSWAVGAGVIEGNNNHLNPHDSATRAEVAAMIQRMCEAVA